MVRRLGSTSRSIRRCSRLANGARRNAHPSGRAGIAEPHDDVETICTRHVRRGRDPHGLMLRRPRDLPRLSGRQLQRVDGIALVSTARDHKATIPPTNYPAERIPRDHLQEQQREPPGLHSSEPFTHLQFGPLQVPHGQSPLVSSDTFLDASSRPLVDDSPAVPDSSLSIPLRHPGTSTKTVASPSVVIAT